LIGNQDRKSDKCRVFVMERIRGRDGKNNGTGGRGTIDFQVLHVLIFDQFGHEQQKLIFHMSFDFYAQCALPFRKEKQFTSRNKKR